MSDDEQQFGLDIPATIQRRGQGLIDGAMKGHSKKVTAEHLEMIDKDGSLIHGKEMLLQMAYELRQLPSSDADESSSSEYAASMCLGMVRQLWTHIPDKQLDPMSNGQFLLVLGYLYGTLTMPSHVRHSKAVEAEIKVLQGNLKRQVGGLRGAETKKATAAERKVVAKRIWDELAATRPTHGLSVIVAKRMTAMGMKVTAKTIRKWRKGGWQ
ncbi:hypothetical protein [Halomonas chromatireducens]|uniref:Uncharacterized protein n=1 Tax=Halomonas chromatireducens TaxID=507626 RepID=A0A0X8HH06_9GAMM|nr:hypothetical protein [Halomonas chromatireducens]AMD02490.1 hypothetical protein LOKO_03450 [Halomonas chromatireducens]